MTETKREVLARSIEHWDERLVRKYPEAAYKYMAEMAGELVAEAEYEFGVRYRLSEEAHGPDVYTYDTAGSEEQARRWMEQDEKDSDESGELVKRRSPGEWEVAE